MKGQAYIRFEGEADTAYRDLFSIYGVTLTRGWREELLKPSSMKEYTKTDSRLENGVRMVAKKKYAKLKERDVQLPFILEGATEEDYLSKYESFLTDMAYSGMVYLKIPIMKRVFKFVYSDCARYGDDGKKIGNFTLKFTEPNPADRIAL